MTKIEKAAVLNQHAAALAFARADYWARTPGATYGQVAAKTTAKNQESRA